MVKGIELFREYFSDYTDQYVLIGGSACDISFVHNEVDFRATRDLDVVLIVEAQTKEFGQKFWDFIRISTEFVLESCELSDLIRDDMSMFVRQLHVTDEELKNLKITGVHEADIVGALKQAYRLP